jgi:hypothetical protein
MVDPENKNIKKTKNESADGWENFGELMPLFS